MHEKYPSKRMVHKLLMWKPRNYYKDYTFFQNIRLVDIPSLTKFLSCGKEKGRME